MIDNTVVELSRLQFGITALYHFLFVPLTLGLSWILVIMESVYVMTGKPVYRDMTHFWGKLFGINFAMGVTTGLTLEFQFGTNWAYYSHYVGDIFGVPLAIEGLMAFFLESTFVGLFFFGWRRLSKVQHLGVTFLVALGSNLSALWILVANGWMNNPVGGHFNYRTMRMELTDLSVVVFNPAAQVKFVHTVSAGYVTASMFVLGISAWYLLRRRHTAIALRSFAIASAFGLASVLSVIVLGDESGYTTGQVQKVKLAAIEAEWDTVPAPAAFTLFGLPDQTKEHTDLAVRVPWVLGLIATRSVDTPIEGLRQLKTENADKVRSGMIAYGALQQLRAGNESASVAAQFAAHGDDLGYGLLLKRYTSKVLDASAAQIDSAAADTIPRVALLFWSFRGMVGLGMLLLATFSFAVWLCARRLMLLGRYRWFLRWSVLAIPLPWVAAELGWIVAECGRQPWTIAGVLPTQLSASTLHVSDLVFSLASFLLFYTVLFVIEMFLMIKYVRLGPPDHDEQERAQSALDRGGERTETLERGLM
ncbi:cytochrome ubiquinol oxidase subunit I [Paraburkholderia megapolitana]|uniref:Cytochrome bd-I ubiquinol oxidase subunit 1 apoprotein n=1 Tax=Paraburkholderia megapolitana TaxID=420953 RepID=A0A1I3Q4K6_9BURK|nr:cytochrome ubiquinol oxidase subunit I [Paraburkholderia megapolitana]QDQ82074.1 cytochrome bd-I ubiquinol oxidase subunit CydA [Paraburkholderia megapolitana]SFJ28347.1 cytochrome bd-I ubiquinol oxidase subunit 1 apoprotein [Paraburkholderia megapolitana]